MEAKHTAHSLSLRYVALEDRIEWLSHCENNRVVSAWVSRRLLVSLLPRLAQWLDSAGERQSDTHNNARTVTEKKHIHRFDHDIAQRQVKSVKGSLPKTYKSEQFLLRHLEFKTTKAGVIIGLAAEKKCIVVAFSASLPELHKVIGELLRISADAGWGINNPWHSIGVDGLQVNTTAVH